MVALLGVVPLLGVGSAALAQSEFGFPASITVDELASGDVPAAASAPVSISLDRVTLPSKAGLPVRQIPTVEILYVEKGTLTVADGLGLSSSLAAEKSVVLRPGSSYTAINDGNSDVSYLRLSFVATSPAATPVTATATEASAGAVVTSLAAFDLDAVPASPSTIFLDRATWKSGSDSGAYTQNGPIGMYTESGTLTISSPSGIDGQLEKGKAVLLPADQPLRTRNDGTDDAVALMFGVIPTNDSAITASAVAVGSAPGDSGTPGVSAGDENVAGTILYQADASGGFEEWSHAGGWVTVSGTLVNDGSNENYNFTAAPFTAPGSDYAVEAEIQWARGGRTFGIVARGGNEEGYAAGFSPRCSGYGAATYLWTVSRDGDERCESIAYLEGAVDTNWHTLRLEVQGNAIRVFLDGAKVIETTDNRFLTSGVVGVWSNGAQVNIRRFTVISLGDS